MTKRQLEQYLKQARPESDVWDAIVRRAAGILTHLSPRTDWAQWLTSRCRLVEVADLHECETRLHAELAKLDGFRRLDAALLARADLWKWKMYDYLLLSSRRRDRKASALVFGCGSGHLAHLLGKQNIAVTGADVRNWMAPKFTGQIPFLPVRKNRVDAPDGSFDQVIAITPFSHAKNPGATIAEIFRLARHRVILMESMVEGADEQERKLNFLVTLWIDWFYHRVIHYAAEPRQKLAVHGNYSSKSGWVQGVKTVTGKEPRTVKDFGVFQWLDPQHHAMLIYDLK